MAMRGKLETCLEGGSVEVGNRIWTPHSLAALPFAHIRRLHLSHTYRCDRPSGQLNSTPSGSYFPMPKTERLDLAASLYWHASRKLR